MLSTQQHLLVSRFDSPSYVFLRDRSVTSEPRQSMKMVIPQQLYNFFIFFFSGRDSITFVVSWKDQAHTKSPCTCSTPEASENFLS